jgi:hypothetical protein
MKGFTYVLVGWVLVTFVYFITLLVSANVVSIGKGMSTQTELFERSQLVIGIALIVVPYVIAGLYSRRVLKNSLSKTLAISIVPVIMERVLILSIGTYFVASGGDGSMNGINLMMFIQGEAAPYFTVPYIICGVFSILITIGFTTLPKTINRIG